ncbi:MAG: Programmed cell death toxin YdcE [Chlamydiia bacterium]|nr:Programmed cell death toxin YdcE [Chlamydiia bacterium]
MKKIHGNQSPFSPLRGDVFWVNFDPTQGTEVKKVRPAIILSNNLFNKHLPRVIVVPITSNIQRIFDFDVLVTIDEKQGKAMLDQVRAIDKSRLGKRICALSLLELAAIDASLKLTFALC